METDIHVLRGWGWKDLLTGKTLIQKCVKTVRTNVYNQPKQMENESDSTDLSNI